ncbi:hypothetical protein ABGB17_18860 [Sphaerisporangium sp. B11E5]|uniref:hypothetical protein n=1 Tax=Sphaerisporangium sp. B11E5 TaxID=3153563 RepID=UPI00325DD7F8
MDVPELLGRATDLVPADARNTLGLAAADVRDLLGEGDWDVALGALQEFEGVEWQPVEFWTVLADVADQMALPRDAAWCHWRASETRAGLFAADLRLVPPDAGGRRIPLRGGLRPMWAVGCPSLPEGLADLHVGVIRVEGAPAVPPGGEGRVRLGPLSPENWWHLRPGDTITMHESRPVAATATITEVRLPRRARR